jgi:hypothetical protein
MADDNAWCLGLHPGWEYRDPDAFAVRDVLETTCLLEDGKGNALRMLGVAEQQAVDVVDHLGIDVPRPIEERLPQQLGSRYALERGQSMSLGNERQELEGAQLLIARRGLQRLER